MSAQKSRVAAIAILATLIKRKKLRRLESAKKRCWVKECISKRDELDVHQNLLKELQNGDKTNYNLQNRCFSKTGQSNGSSFQLTMARTGFDAVPVTAASLRPSCSFGIQCYRINREHRSLNAHPGDSDYRPDFPNVPIVIPVCNSMNSYHVSNASEIQQLKNFQYNLFLNRRTAKVDRQILKMVVKGSHALSIVDDPEFRKLIELVSFLPNYKLPTFSTLKNVLLPSNFEEVNTKVFEELQSTSAICISTDLWTSTSNQKYLAITAHFLDSNTTLKARTLNCVKHAERYSKVALAKFFKNTFAHWQISGRITAIVSGKGVNVKEAVKFGQWPSVTCFAHSLNIIVHQSIGKIQELRKKASDIVNYLQRNNKALKEFEKVQYENDFCEVRLKSDVVTRWKSTYTMFDRLYTNMEVLEIMLPNHKPELCISTNDWILMDQVLKILQPFHEVATDLLSKKYVHLSQVLLLSKMLQSHLAEIPTADEMNSFPEETQAKITEFVSCLRNGMASRFDEIEHNPLYAESTILDPRIKSRGFKNEQCFKTAFEQLKNKLPIIKKEEDPLSAFYEEGLKLKGLTNRMRSIWDKYDREFGSLQTDASQELNKYLLEDYLDRKEDPLVWWNERKLQYPLLFNVVLKRLCLVAASVPSEPRLVSDDENITDKKSSLETINNNKLTFLHYNME